VARSPRRRLAAIVLNHRTAEDTDLAVSSLLASTRKPDDVILVDNDIADECRAQAARWGSEVTYLHTGQNLGFSGGMNVGIRVALTRGADLVVLVNSDVVLPPGCLERLEAAFAEVPGPPFSNLERQIGIAAPLVLSRSAPDIITSAGIDYAPHTGRMRHRGYGMQAREWRHTGRGPDAVSGCLMVVARDVFERIGLLDERYFFGFEDIDFCLRARAAGFGVHLVPGAAVHHEGGRAIGATSPRRLYFAARNHLLLASLSPASPGGFMRKARVVSIAALNLAHAFRAGGATLPTRLGATARGIGDYLKGRSGPDPRA